MLSPLRETTRRSPGAAHSVAQCREAEHRNPTPCPVLTRPRHAWPLVHAPSSQAPEAAVGAPMTPSAARASRHWVITRLTSHQSQSSLRSSGRQRRRAAEHHRRCLTAGESAMAAAQPTHPCQENWPQNAPVAPVTQHRQSTPFLIGGNSFFAPC